MQYSFRIIEKSYGLIQNNKVLHLGKNPDAYWKQIITHFYLELIPIAWFTVFELTTIIPSKTCYDLRHQSLVIIEN